MANPHNKDGAPPREIHVEDKKTNWLAWAALIAGLLALLLALSRCNNDDNAIGTAANVTETVYDETVDTAAPVTDEVAYTSGVGTYLAGNEPLPRTFIFEKLNFDTGKSQVRPADRAEIANIVSSLKDRATSRVRVVGYADARGGDAANAALGKSRADSVKAALVAGGIAADRVETASGGETNPVDSNATSEGQAENRRTELVVLSR